jgi:glycosyltransferase involved in cell wall biosynthesis
VEISAVLPTYDRAAALRVNLASFLALEGVGELVVVDDGSRDDTAAVLAAAGDPRLVVVRQDRNRGAPAARNAGVAAARGEWIVFVEDDCRFPADFALVLRDEARRHGADVVGAPMVWPRPGESVEDAVAAARARGTGENGLDEPAGFAADALVTPLLPAPALVRRALAAELRFDEGYGGNAYREETDFFLRATRAGARCVLTPRTFFWEPGRWSGGQSRPRLAAELWTVRNNWRFLRRHGDWLAASGHIASPAREQARFVGRRARRLAADLAPVSR